MRNNSIICFLFFVGFLVPTVCCANEALLCKSIEAIQQGDSLVLNMEIVYTDGLAKNESMDIIPALACENQIYMLPKVILNGTQRHKVFARQFASDADSKQDQFASVYTEQVVSQQGTASVAYRVVVPFSAWMEGAVLRVFCSECECGIGVPAAQVEATEYAMDVVLEKERIFDAIAPEVSYITPNIRSAKQQEPTYRFFVDYDISETALDETIKGNQRAWSQLQDRVAELIAQKAQVNKLVIKGYASPDGIYAVNKTIAMKRARYLSDSLMKIFALPKSVLDVQYVDEDWEGLERLLNAEEVPFKADALSIIRNVGVFDGRERKLMELGNGALYHYMAAYYFPKLRRVEIQLDYTEQQRDLEELKNQWTVAPESMQLDEMNRLLACLEPGAEEYKQILARIRREYPHHETAILNEIACAISDRDWESAEELSAKTRTSSRCLSYENNMGVLCLKNGDYAKAEAYFRSASLGGLAVATHNLEKLLIQKRIGDN